jgi:DNA-binding GntR family transcriptional regulator
MEEPRARQTTRGARSGSRKDGPLGPPLDRDQFGSAADYSYAVLRREIVEGRFAPGRRMREIELSEWLGVSRTPLRQALARLEVEGLLVMTARTGLVVASLDEEAMAELYDMREALEGAAAALAARHAGPRDVAALRALVETERRLSADPAVRAEHNLAFHQAIYAAAHNRFLVKSLHALHDAIALLGPTTFAVEGRPKQAEREHARIVDAIAARQPAEAEAAAREAARPKFVMPIDGARFTSCFGGRWGTFHYGIDLAAPMRTPEYAAGDGVVLRAGAASGFGLAVYILHENGDVTVYGHMDEILVEPGQYVDAGETIALLGNRGQSTGPHLHFEVHRGGEDGQRINPIPWLAERGVHP